jgi:ribose transport system permease protein
MTKDNVMNNSRIDDFKGFVGAVLTLLILAFPHIGGLSQEFVTAAVNLQKNMALFLTAGCIALIAAVFNLIWGNRARLPKFFYAVPFLTLLLGLALWRAAPDHGTAGALRGMLSAVEASAASRVLWGLLFSGALIGFWGGFSSLKEDVIYRFGSRYGVVMIFIALFSLSSEMDSGFLQAGNVLNILRQVSYIGIIALGMTFVMTSGGVDLSVGSFSALAGGIVIGTLNICVASWGDGGLAVTCALIAGLLLGAYCGFLSGFIIAGTRVEPFIVTLGTMAIYRSLAVYMANGGEFRSKSALFQEIGMGSDPFFSAPYPVWAFLLLTLFCATLFNWNKFGRHLKAVGSNERAAVYAAVKVGKTRVLAYMLIGVMTAIAAFFSAARMGFVNPAGMGAGVEMDAIASVLFGGGYISGTVMGSMILVIVNNMLDMSGVSPFLQGTVKGIVIIVAVMVRRKNR